MVGLVRYKMDPSGRTLQRLPGTAAVLFIQFENEYH